MEAAVILLLVSLFVLSVLLALTRWLVPKALAEEPTGRAGGH
ncbi:hypothetical protein HLRTI_000900 [Halorhabdus tiamatea SARL4B]|uniref:Uncharacterized protein n=1 Tax=Halorhabdus tiamatea SARL4B TaxID=1033806 RepID=F7PII4_9EURY|nr:hypothetical protein [Halorhabdus tiamatea]ERJ07042.1 hypothetical protein HLRTI_000900 [Halorhabdus tiamatea SARL4B]CCQ34808.1 hypothetical protein HTIA_2704 [Halorhabdus tiamatea SARL4B]